ncbi:MAG: anaerobic ribonucleoside-triphosphate reductase activating protein [Candidatus Bathyarchaeia archaeon]
MLERHLGNPTGVEIKGFIDLSMVDWDGKVSAVIFLPRCNFRCPFCYNVALVLTPDELPTIPFEKIGSYLQRHKDGIEGVVITGGEPTIHRNLPDLCRRLKNLGIKVKLDTNGSNPSMVRELMKKHLIDYIALDVKAPLTVEDYSRAIGVDGEVFLKMIEETMSILMESDVDYEFRTTVIPTIHTEEDIRSICKAISGCRRYVLQNFKEGVKMIDPSFEKLKPFSKEEMERFLCAARRYVKNTKIRG